MAIHPRGHQKRHHPLRGKRGRRHQGASRGLHQRQLQLQARGPRSSACCWNLRFFNCPSGLSTNSYNTYCKIQVGLRILALSNNYENVHSIKK